MKVVIAYTVSPRSLNIHESWLVIVHDFEEYPNANVEDQIHSIYIVLLENTCSITR
jgi:hypothetical protein